MNYYHVAPAEYQTGDDLLSFDEQCALGWEPTWKWDCDYVDTDVVCLFSSLEAAREYRDECRPTDRILQVSIPSDDDMVSITTVAEGYTAVYRRIPAQYISESK